MIGVLATADFIYKGSWSVHSFNGDYLSVPSAQLWSEISHQISLMCRHELSLRFMNIALPNSFTYKRWYIPHTFLIDPLWRASVV